MVVNIRISVTRLSSLLALPATFCGMSRMLYITYDAERWPSLMGAIMAVGVASANSILLVTFAANSSSRHDAFDAAILAGHTRIRPVLMIRDRDDRRHDPDGDRGPGEERTPPGARRHRRPAVRNPDHSFDRASSSRCCAGNDGKEAHGVFEKVRMNDVARCRSWKERALSGGIAYAEPPDQRAEGAGQVGVGCLVGAFCRHRALALGVWQHYDSTSRSSTPPRSSPISFQRPCPVRWRSVTTRSQ